MSLTAWLLALLLITPLLANSEPRGDAVSAEAEGNSDTQTEQYMVNRQVWEYIIWEFHHAHSTRVTATQAESDGHQNKIKGII